MVELWLLRKLVALCFCLGFSCCLWLSMLLFFGLLCVCIYPGCCQRQLCNLLFVLKAKLRAAHIMTQRKKENISKWATWGKQCSLGCCLCCDFSFWCRICNGRLWSIILWFGCSRQGLILGRRCACILCILRGLPSFFRFCFHSSRLFRTCLGLTTT